MPCTPIGGPCICPTECLASSAVYVLPPALCMSCLKRRGLPDLRPCSPLCCPETAVSFAVLPLPLPWLRGSGWLLAALAFASCSDAETNPAPSDIVGGLDTTFAFQDGKIADTGTKQDSAAGNPDTALLLDTGAAETDVVSASDQQSNQDVAGQTDTSSGSIWSATACFPCQIDADCQPAGQALCVAFANGARYCAQPCATAGLCPSAFACVQASSATSGQSAKQCLPLSGQCPCTAAAVTAGAATSCTKGNLNGQCKGTRVCTASGLGPCNAPTPAPETCNTIDDDCDGEVDEGLLCNCPDTACLIGDKCISAGSKNPLDPCKVCNPLQNAQDWSVQNGLACDDGNACTQGEKCSSGQCQGGSAVDCSAWNSACAIGVCGAKGCAAQPKSGGSCDDGDPCTSGDICSSGQCKGAPKDCSAFDNACSGKGICVGGQCQSSGSGGTPVCTAGAQESESQPCGNCGTQTRKRTCTNVCSWGAWSAWSDCAGVGVCMPGATEACTEGCEVKTCSNSCQWGACGLKEGAVCSWKAGTNYQCCGDGKWQFCSSKTCNWFPCADISPNPNNTCVP